jgi:uncharacterized protein (TIGR02271 family)
VERIRQRLPANAEELVQERVPVKDGDSARIETMPDGSVSIPLYEEELVVTKRIVLRERVLVRKETVTRPRRVEAELRREEVEIENDLDDELENPG